MGVDLLSSWHCFVFHFCLVGDILMIVVLQYMRTCVVSVGLPAVSPGSPVMMTAAQCFNCAVCHKDVSIPSRGPRGIWRQFKCKGHLAKDQRYRLDHEDYFYTDKLDAIPVAENSAELRNGIEKTPSVTLGKMNKLLEDEVDALVGIPFNVLPTTLVSCLLELLRSGGSQVFLRRLWNQFRTTLLVESSYVSVTWSKTETVVVLVQTLYPRNLRRVKSWLGDSSFSLAVQFSSSGVRCTVRCCSGDSIREVCNVDEDCGAVLSEAYIRCLPRALSLVSTRRGSVAIENCPPILFNSYVDWCRLVGRHVPIVSVSFGSELLRRLVNDACFACSAWAQWSHLLLLNIS